MRIYADLHIHGKYSRACSKAFSVANIEKYAKIKGLNLMGTADFTHPLWLKELKDNLTQDTTAPKEEYGFLHTKSGFRFIPTTEISLIYTQGGSGRRVHHVITAPNFDTVDHINSELLKLGRLDYDGRPIFKLTSIELVDMLRSIDKRIEVIPAHIWTPWFGMLGSKSGFNSLKECFGDNAKHIHAIETGLSSDPEMNWRIKELDNRAILSFSDSHSFWPHRIGRENTVFDIKESYDSLIKSIRTKQGLIGTNEFWPHEGKYHYDGHRNCNVVMNPKEALKHNNICPVCKKPLTIGVMHRVEELANREEGKKPSQAKPFKKLIPLSELVSHSVKANIMTKKTWSEYNNLIDNFGSEMKILLQTPKEDLIKVTSQELAQLIMKNRNEQISFRPGYDGVYGKPILGNDNPNILQSQNEQLRPSQKSITDF